MQNEYDICGMKFHRAQFDGLDGKTVVAYTEDSGIANPFQVRVTKEGLRFKGEMQGAISSESDVQDLARFMSDWVQDVRRLRPKITTSFLDKVDPVV